MLIARSQMTALTGIGKMARLLARSSRAFMSGVLREMDKEMPVSFSAISSVVAQDEGEIDPVRKVLAYMVKAGHATIEGEGDTATYRLTDSGETLYNDLLKE